MSKLKSLAANTAIFGISQFASKILVFFLLPLYTAYMTEEDYGSADLVFSTVSLLLPICTLEISSAVMRFTLEKRNESAPFFGFGFFVISIGFIVLLLFSPVFILTHLFEGYLYLFYILFLANAFYMLLSYYARGIQRIKLVGVIGVVNTVAIVGFNLAFLIGFRMGLFGYLLSYIGGYLVSDLCYLFALKRSIFSRRSEKKNRSEYKAMVKYSVPLVPNNISWWLVSSANKYVIYGYLNKAVLGLYSVALKVPTIINTIQGVFSEALVLSVLQEYNNKEKDEQYFSFLYKLYSTFSVFITSGIILFSKVIADILFSNDFYRAWVYVPLLCIPSVWGALSGYLGTFYLATKKNNGMFISTMIGGIVTIVFSLATVRFFGVYGIIAGNLLSYFIIWLYRWLDVRRLVTLTVHMTTDVLAWILLILQALAVMLIRSSVLMYCCNAAIVLILIALKRETVFLICRKSAGFIFDKLRKKKETL